MLQRSVRISPRDLLGKTAAWMANRHMQEYAVCFEVEKVGLLSDEKIVEIAWPGLDAIAALYAEYPGFCETAWEEWIRGDSNREERGARAIAVVSTLRHRLSKIVEMDPLLPGELLPDSVPRDKALKAFCRYRARFQRVLKKRVLKS